MLEWAGLHLLGGARRVAQGRRAGECGSHRRCCGARRKGSCGNLQAGLNPSPTGATPRLEITSPLWMLELRLSFLTWGLEYAQSRISELEEASCSGKDVCGPSPPA